MMSHRVIVIGSWRYRHGGRVTGSSSYSHGGVVVTEAHRVIEVLSRRLIESWRRCHGGVVMEVLSWRMTHRVVVIESWGCHHGG